MEIKRGIYTPQAHTELELAQIQYAPAAYGCRGWFANHQELFEPRRRMGSVPGKFLPLVLGWARTTRPDILPGIKEAIDEFCKDPCASGGAKEVVSGFRSLVGEDQTA